MLSFLKKIIRQLLFPQQCLGCQKENQILCPECLKSIRQLSWQVCPLCEKSVTKNGEICRSCRQQTNVSLDRLLVVADYKDKLLATAIHYLKYKFVKKLAAPLSQIMIEKLRKSSLPIPDLIIPVPLHPYRLRWRGFNQSELLAQEIASQLLPSLEIPLVKNLVNKKRYTTPQRKIKKYRQRQENVRHSFQINKDFDWQQINRSSQKNLNNLHVLLVDDVSTTGATLFTLAREVKKLQPKSISAIVLGRQH